MGCRGRYRRKSQVKDGSAFCSDLILPRLTQRTHLPLSLASP